MSNDRSPRASCWITTGTRGISSPSTMRNQEVARLAAWYYPQPMSCVNREIVLPVPRERAWELVTDPDELREWLAHDVEFEAEEGAPIRADEGDRGVEVVDERGRVVFRWGESR